MSESWCRHRGSVRIGMWLSLVERVVRDDEVGGSNPLIPTNLLLITAPGVSDADPALFP